MNAIGDAASERHPLPVTPDRLTLSVATDKEREKIYQCRHEVYARELGQHQPNESRALRDPLDAGNIYLVAKVGVEIAGFISITLPSQGMYSIDKYFARELLPFTFDRRLFEIRLLTVLRPHRGRELATLLMYAAFRWIESHGGREIVAIGRREILDMYLKAGLKAVGKSTRSGAVTYDLLGTSVAALREHLRSWEGLLARLESKTSWDLDFPFYQPAGCFHGGAFFEAIGERFDALARHRHVINADVLDAWFPPAPGVMAALGEELPWILRTSPPTACEGLIETVGETRGVQPENILPGAGSSDLIFRALREWLSARSSVLVLDPTYGEYGHVLERVIGCTVDHLTLDAESNFDIPAKKLEAALADEYDLVVLVNPNSPTGRFVPRAELEQLLRRVPNRTRVWVDETYVDYAGRDSSLETFAANSENIIVCKSMSKVYALSGARAAYLCAGPHQLEQLRAVTPPWVVSLPAQIAAVRALQDPAYYAARYCETHQYRQELARSLHELGWRVIPGAANFLLCLLPPELPGARELVAASREQGLFLRDASAMGSRLGTSAVRIAVKDSATNARMLQILERLCRPS